MATTWSRRGERGQAMLEFAFVLPVLMLVVVGMIEFALAFNATLGVNRASQDAASWPPKQGTCLALTA